MKIIEYSNFGHFIPSDNVCGSVLLVATKAMWIAFSSSRKLPLICSSGGTRGANVLLFLSCRTAFLAF